MSEHNHITPKTTKNTKNAVPAQRHARNDTSWGSVAQWYAQHLESRDTYHAQVILPHLLRLIRPQRGERILDIACGEGYITRALYEHGAAVEGVDIAQELIAIARQKNPHIPYHIASAEALDNFPSNTYQQATIVLAIQNIAHVDRVFREAARVLTQGGILHIVLNHPAFRIPRHSAWEYHEKGRIQSRRIDRYLSEIRAEVEMHPGIPGSPKTISFHRPLQYYFKALHKAGFAVDRLEEWISHKRSTSGPRAAAENISRKEIPLFLYLCAKQYPKSSH